MGIEPEASAEGEVQTTLQASRSRGASAGKAGSAHGTIARSTPRGVTIMARLQNPAFRLRDMVFFVFFFKTLLEPQTM